MHGKKVAIFGVFTALALIFSYVELLIPINFGIPGAKLGLANLMTVLVLYKMGTKEALALSVTRIILSGFMFGNLFGILYSLAGGLLSFLVMVLLKRSDWLSVVGVSIGGGTAHNIGQLLVAMVVVQTYQVGYSAGFVSGRRSDRAADRTCGKRSFKKDPGNFSGIIIMEALRFWCSGKRIEEDDIIY